MLLHVKVQNARIVLHIAFRASRTESLLCVVIIVIVFEILHILVVLVLVFVSFSAIPYMGSPSRYMSSRSGKRAKLSFYAIAVIKMAVVSHRAISDELGRDLIRVFTHPHFFHTTDSFLWRKSLSIVTKGSQQMAQIAVLPSLLWRRSEESQQPGCVMLAALDSLSMMDCL
jgi:hypothetical protein